MEDILVDKATLRRARIPVIHSDRGGRVTYHGPGQLVGYLVMNLRTRHLSIPQFVRQVEEGLRLWCLKEGVASSRRNGLPGLWYRGSKLASVGFHISRGISRHGFAVNLACDLRFFEWIIPCGERAVVTSLKKITGKDFSLMESARDITCQLDSVFSESSEDSLLSLANDSVSSSEITSSSA